MYRNNMYRTHHRFHVPVMGTGFTIDTALRVARFGIASVISIVDDMLIERVRKHYCRESGLSFEPIPHSHPDARAARITAYLNLVQDLVDAQIEELRRMHFAPGNDKSKYFELLPASSPVRALYGRWLSSAPAGKPALESELNAAILPGSVDANIMTKLDRIPYGRDGKPRPVEFSDAKAALRGFANSKVRGNMVFSAGINPTLYGTLEQFPDFYRQEDGTLKKGVILKVSDYRSCMVQGRFLAKKGIEIREFRIESALNCGGHAFASDGYLMGPILQEFKDNRDKFPGMFEPLIEAYYQKRERKYPESCKNRRMDVTAQGGLGTHDEMRRLFEIYGIDAAGWASPFLLVPEVTALDDITRKQLADAGEEDLYQSDASPLGIIFNNLRGSTSDQWTRKQIDEGKPGSPCPKGYLVSNTEFTPQPICTASKQYQKLKLKALGYDAPPPVDHPDPAVQKVYAKQCICDQLGNGALIQQGEIAAYQPVSVCPGPNIAYFDRLYTLREMVDHIYGRGPSLVPESRPHMFAKDMLLYVDYFEKLVHRHLASGDPRSGYLREFKDNLEAGMRYYEPLLIEGGLPGENIASLVGEIRTQALRVAELWLEVMAKFGEDATHASDARVVSAAV